MNLPDLNDDSELKSADAFVNLLMEHRHRLFAFILKQLINQADAEDVFQKTSVILWKKMDQFDNDSSFFHWACGIAYNEVRNFLKVQRRSRLHFDDELTALLAQEARDEDVASESRLNAMRKCLNQLSDRQQRILRRCYSGSESITQVAEQLRRERTALYKQLARLRDKLVACIRLQLAKEGGTS
jgi:RNA polymerase sigma-70 factor (ECF subfamily)